MSRLDAMQHFVRVADLGSFAAAADQLGVARSVVTRRIAALEEHLGVKLITRTTRKLTLTSAGLAYLERCRSILQALEDAESEVMASGQTPRGHIHMGLPVSFGIRRIAPLLAQFGQAYPHITLTLDFNDRTSDLIDEAMDIAIRVSTELAPGVVARKLGQGQFFTVAAPAYLARHGTPQHPGDLLQHPCLGYTGRANNRPWHFTVEGQLQSFAPDYVLQANNGDALTLAAQQGLGITVQPDFIVQEALASGALQPILQAFAPPPFGIYAILPGNRLLTQRQRVVIDFLAQALRSEPGQA
ncbi:HTH-type transcriptional regulator DmlR [uncultured Comamonas sp.]|nr:HTH-type transcriptional regulator DmlR [uncultured Comamonas sp.]